MKRQKTYPKLKDLSERQRGHLAWRLDHHTYCGMITASHIARLNHIDLNNRPVNEVLEEFDMTPHQAKIHANKIVNF